MSDKKSTRWLKPLVADWCWNDNGQVRESPRSGNEADRKRMSSTVDRLRAEIAAQLAEEARSPFEDVDEVRSFIDAEKPAPTDNITLDMCYLGAKEYIQFWHVYLLSHADEQVFDTVAEMVEGMDPARRSKYIFVLTIWKSRDELLNVINFREGLSYRFEKVHSLKLVYGNPVGSMQIRRRLRADPIVAAGSSVHDVPIPHEPSPSDSEQMCERENHIPPPLTTTPCATVAAEVTLMPGQAQSCGMVKGTTSCGAENEASTSPLVKTPSKRRTRRGDGKVDETNNQSKIRIDVPSKKPRKVCAKEFVFASSIEKSSAA